MLLVTAAIHSFLYFFLYVGGGSFAGAMMFVVLGIALVGVHTVVWAVARYANAAWAIVAALVANGACVFAALIWPFPTGLSSDWQKNSLVFMVIGLLTGGVLIGYVRFVHRRFPAPRIEHGRRGGF